MEQLQSKHYQQHSNVTWPTTAMIVNLCTQTPSISLTATYNDIRFNKEETPS